MKYLVIIFMVLATNSCSLFNKENKTCYSFDNFPVEYLKGTVKRISVDHCRNLEDKFGELIKNEMHRRINYSIDFDKNGQMSNANYHIYHNGIETKYLYKYAKGDLIEKNQFNSVDKLEYNYSYKYDEQGNVKEEYMCLPNNKILNKRKYKYNSIGKIVEQKKYCTDGKLEFIISFNYNDSEKKVEEKKILPNGELCCKYSYKYNGKGEKTEIIDFGLNGSPDIFSTYEYNSKGNVIELNIYEIINNMNQRFKTLKKRYTYKYNNKGKELECKEFNPDGNLINVVISIYNDRNDIVEYKKYNSNNECYLKASFEYKYDNKGNWFKKIKYINSIPKELYERKIEYYNL